MGNKQTDRTIPSNVDAKSRIAELAKLSELDYEIGRTAFAKKLSMRASALDDLVKKARTKANAGDKGQAKKKLDILLRRHFMPLGYDHGTYYFLPNGSRQILDLTAAQMRTDANLFQLAPGEVWMKAFGDENGYWKPSDAADYLINGMGHPTGVFTPKNVRGRGVWNDDGRLVVHLGDRLIVDGRVTRIERHKSRYCYELAESLPAATDAPLTDAEGKELLDVLSSLRWEREVSGRLFAGFLFLAPICGSLQWRPHVWLTGAAQSGKTTAMGIMSRALETTAVKPILDSTSPGIRQYLGSDALPVIYDESEAENFSDLARLQAVLSLARQASSETGGKVMKGTTSGKGMQFECRSMFCFSSINVQATARADQERVTVLQLRSARSMTKEERVANEVAFEKVKMRRDALLTSGFSDRLLARAVRLIPMIRESAERFGQAVASVVDDRRMGDQLGTLLAGAWHLTNEAVVAVEETESFVAGMMWDGHVADADETEERKLFDAIMEAVVPADGRTVAEMIHAAAFKNDGCGDEELQRAGIRVLPEKGVFHLLSNGTRLKEFLKGTPWANAYSRILLRHPKASNGGIMRMAKNAPKQTIKFPFDVLEDVLPTDGE